MPQIVSCPDCGRKLRVPDHLLGKTVKCPGCGQKFPAAAGGGSAEGAAPAAARGRDVSYRSAEDDAPKSRRPAAEPEDEDYPVSKRRRREDDDDDVRDRPVASRADVRQGWERVRFGINLVIVGVWIFAGTVVAAISGWLLLMLFGLASFGSMASSLPAGGGTMSQQQASQMAGQAAGTGVAIMVGGCVVGGLVILLALARLAACLTGEGFCMGIAPTPKTQMLRGLAIAAFGIGVANPLLLMGSLGGSFALARNGGGCIGFGGWGLAGCLMLAEFICFGIFLRGVASVMKKDGLATNIIIQMVGTIIWFVAAPVMWILFLFLAGAAMFTSVASSAGSNNPSTMAGNMAGTGAAMLVGGVVCGALLFLIGLALFIWYIILLYQVRGAVTGWLDRN